MPNVYGVPDEFYEAHGRLMQAYCERVAELEGYAAEEGITPSLESKLEFYDWIEMLHWEFDIPRAMLVMTDPGNIRATWKHNKNRMGLEFMGNGTADYVRLMGFMPDEWGTVSLSDRTWLWSKISETHYDYV